MKKMMTLGVALVSVFTAMSANTSAAEGDGDKRGYHRPGNHYRPGHYRPGYVAPAPVVRPHHGHGYRPVYNYGHNYNYAHNYRGGYWRNGRWIAPIVIGAAIGGLAIAAATPVYAAPTVTYVAPPVYGYADPMSVNYSPIATDGFDYADSDRDGLITYQEAATYPHWQRNFGAIDRNHDGYLTSYEVVGWRYH